MDGILQQKQQLENKLEEREERLQRKLRQPGRRGKAVEALVKEINDIKECMTKKVLVFMHYLITNTNILYSYTLCTCFIRRAFFDRSFYVNRHWNFRKIRK